jgi:preprotein translocase subunit SecG
MQTVLIVIHLLVVIALVAVVLLQRSEGGALGAGGGGGGFMTGRGQANALSRATAILATLFFATSILMSIIAGWSRAPRSIIDTTAPASTAAPDVKKPQGSLLDQLKEMQNQQPGGAPAAPAPAEPAPAAPAAPAQEPPK